MPAASLWASVTTLRDHHLSRYANHLIAMNHYYYAWNCPCAHHHPEREKL